MKPVLPFYKLCRLCLTINNDSERKDIFSNKLDIMIKESTSIQISQSDSVPNTVCSNCFSDVIRFYKFWINLHKNDFVIKNYLTDYNEITDEIALLTIIEDFKNQTQISNVLEDLNALGAEISHEVDRITTNDNNVISHHESNDNVELYEIVCTDGDYPDESEGTSENNAEKIGESVGKIHEPSINSIKKIKIDPNIDSSRQADSSCNISDDLHDENGERLIEFHSNQSDYDSNRLAQLSNIETKTHQSSAGINDDNNSIEADNHQSYEKMNENTENNHSSAGINDDTFETNNDASTQNAITCNLCSMPLPDRNEFRKHFLKNHIIKSSKDKSKFVSGKVNNKEGLAPGEIICTLCNHRMKKQTFKDHMLTAHFPVKNMKKVKKRSKYLLTVKSKPFTITKTEFAEDCDTNVNSTSKIIEESQEINSESPILDDTQERTQEKNRPMKSVTCQICGKSYKNLRYLERHNQLHTTIKLNSFSMKESPRVFMNCHYCKFSTVHNSNLAQHTRYFHLTQHICHHCGISLSRHKMKNHLRVHVPKEKCAICGLEFNRYHMAAHKQIHLPADQRTQNVLKRQSAFRKRDTTLINCEICLKQIKKCHYTKHVNLIHKRTAAVDCDVCGFQARDPFQMKNHRRIHTGERPFKCPYCPKSFRVKGILSRHIPIHTGEKKYTCHLCGKGYIQYVSYKTHMKNQHPNAPVKDDPKQIIE